MKDINKNISIVSDDAAQNDYLTCWSYYNERPNKILVSNIFSKDLFYSSIEKFKEDNNIVKTELNSFKIVMPSDSGQIVTEKILDKLDDIFISYLISEKGTDNEFISDCCIYFKSGSEKLSNDLYELILSSIESPEQEDNSEEDTPFKFSSITVTQEGIDAEYIDDILSANDVKKYYDDIVVKDIKSLVEDIDSNNKGLSIIYGEKGCGKTSLLNYTLSRYCTKGVFYIPYNLVDSIFTHVEFLNFLIETSPSVIVIDDCETLISDNIQGKVNYFTNTLIQMIDGYQSNDINTNIILISNDDNFDNDIILDCNNLLNIKEVGRLSVDKAKKLSKHLKRNLSIESPMRINDIIRGISNTKKSNTIGF